MARKTTIQAALDKAAADATRNIVVEALSNMSANTTIGELHSAMSKSDFGSAFQSMTIAEFTDAVGQAAAAPQARRGRKPAAARVPAKAPRKNVNTRTHSGRATLDTAVRDFLRANGSSRSEQITPNVPGDTAQVRQSLKRLMAAGEVSVKGNRRASEYSMTSAASKAPAKKKLVGERTSKERSRK